VPDALDDVKLVPVKARGSIQLHLERLRAEGCRAAG
jgi:hypothetical protein